VTEFNSSKRKKNREGRDRVVQLGQREEAGVKGGMGGKVRCRAVAFGSGTGI